MIAWRIQEQAYGGLDRAMLKLLESYARGRNATAEGTRRLKAGAVLMREYQGERHTVTVASDGFVWREQTYQSLSGIARAITGISWNGSRFFGLRESDKPNGRQGTAGSGQARGGRRCSPARGKAPPEEADGPQ